MFVHIIKSWSDKDMEQALCGDRNYRVAQRVIHYFEYLSKFEDLKHCKKCVKAAEDIREKQKALKSQKKA